MFREFIGTMGFVGMTPPRALMIGIGFLFLYIGIVKKKESLLLVPMAFGMILANLPFANLSAHDEGYLLNFMYQGIHLIILPPLIFLCIGALTDFGPLISNKKTVFIGIGGQLGIIMAFFLAQATSLIPGFAGFGPGEAAAIAIIGSSDGPTAIFTSAALAPHLLPAIAIAAYSYMALVPLIQPPIMRALTTHEERIIVMPPPKQVTKTQKIVFPIVMTVVIILLVPAAGALLGMLLLGNLIRECGVTERYSQTLQNEFLNILTLILALALGASATAEAFLTPTTLIITVLGLLAFVFGTVGGVLMAKLLCKLTGGKINPLIGNSGVSAMPMAARVSQSVGQEYNPQNHLLMHAMGPIVASTVGSAIFAGIFVTLLR
ncbi:MAG: sodium ion-translocating decarboxylase subunit beta [Oscillospiraceae bacterium]|nr:sodium ion-translocating decarboxylase subunit beta [Oscillospiraceae bacterium]